MFSIRRSLGGSSPGQSLSADGRASEGRAPSGVQWVGGARPGGRCPSPLLSVLAAKGRSGWHVSS